MRLCGFDFETFPWGKGYGAPQPVCLSWYTPHNDDGDVLLARDAEKLLRDKLTDKKTILVAHNAAFDSKIIWQWYPDLRYLLWEKYEAGLLACTNVREAILNIAQDQTEYYRKGKQNRKTSLSLEGLVWRYFDRKVDGKHGEDAWRLRYGELHGIPIDEWPQEAYDYSLFDSVEATNVFEVQEVRADDMGYEMPTEWLNTYADLSLSTMAAWGIEDDPELADRLFVDLSRDMSETREELLDHGLVKFKRKMDRTAWESGVPLDDVQTAKNMTLLRQLVEKRWPKGKGLPLTKKGAVAREKAKQAGKSLLGVGVKTDGKTLDKIPSPEFAAWRRFVKAEKLRSGFVAPVQAANGGPIHASFWVLGARSERTSSSKPNLQNQSKREGVREMFVPRPGHVFIACDYSAQEMRTLAQTLLDLVGWSVLAEKFQEDPDFDPHQEFSNEHNIPRDNCKAANFGFPGGMGIHTFMAAYEEMLPKGFSEEDAKALRNAWFRQWPEMRKYFALINDIVENYGGVIEVPATGFIRGGCRFTNGCNTPFQHLGAAATKHGMILVTRACLDETRNSPLLGSRLVNMVHDELLVETPIEVAHLAAAEVERLMVQGMEQVVRDIPARAEAALMFNWSKKARDVYYAGKMVPWDKRIDERAVRAHSCPECRAQPRNPCQGKHPHQSRWERAFEDFELTETGYVRF